MDHMNNRRQSGFGSNLILVGAISLLSIVFLYLFERYFVAGLFTSMLISNFAETTGQAVLFGIIAAIPCIVFILLGIIANKFEKLWPHIVGLVIYALDTLILLGCAVLTNTFSNILLDFAFHILFVFWIASSMRAFIKYKNSPKEAQQYVYSNAYTISSDEPVEDSGDTVQETAEEPETGLANGGQNSEPANDITDEETAGEAHEELGCCGEMPKNDGNVPDGEKEAE